jgi:hypothetical protein
LKNWVKYFLWGKNAMLAQTKELLEQASCSYGNYGKNAMLQKP